MELLCGPEFTVRETAASAGASETCGASGIGEMGMGFRESVHEDPTDQLGPLATHWLGTSKLVADSPNLLEMQNWNAVGGRKQAFVWPAQPASFPISDSLILPVVSLGRTGKAPVLTAAVGGWQASDELPALSAQAGVSQGQPPHPMPQQSPIRRLHDFSD